MAQGIKKTVLTLNMPHNCTLHLANLPKRCQAPVHPEGAPQAGMQSNSTPIDTAAAAAQIKLIRSTLLQDLCWHGTQEAAAEHTDQGKPMQCRQRNGMLHSGLKTAKKFMAAISNVDNSKKPLRCKLVHSRELMSFEVRRLKRMLANCVT